MRASWPGLVLLFFCGVGPALAGTAPQAVSAADFYPVGQLPPTDSHLAVAVGDRMPDFDLPAVGGGRMRLSDYLGRKNLVVTFVPAAWTPFCSGQWPGYNIAENVFQAKDAALVGISADNIPTLYAWTRQMGSLWFPVASDFGPMAGWPKSSASCVGTAPSNGRFLSWTKKRHPVH